ncbi:ABC transporter permease, partial [Candidatus Saccharibacteria bacterium]|nr:ABC transporter permease [Candidatus Saccharibacteria bacterium]
MKVTAVAHQSMRSIWTNKVRSSLTILGIVIGIAAVISLVGLGKGLESSVTNRISSLGTTDISIQSQDPTRATAQRTRSGGEGPMGGGGQGGPGGFSFGSNSTASITTDEYTYIKNLDGIAQASPSESSQVAVTKSSSSDTASQYQLYGVDTDYLSLESLKVSEGVALTEAQISNSEKVVLIGSDAAEELYGTTSPVGKKVYIEDDAYTIVGVVSREETSSQNGDQQGMGGGGPGGVNRVTSSFITGYKRWMTQTDTEKISTVTAK